MTTPYEQTYLDTARNILEKGRWKASRPGQRTLSSDTEQMVIDISGNLLPLLSTKQIFYKTFIHETIWFLSGSTNVKYLKDHNISIWDSWVLPKTAVFEPTETPSASDILTYIRCKLDSDVFKAWTAYKDAQKAGIPKLSEVQAFIAHFVALFPETKNARALNTLPKMKLISGDIGSGAYGASWRKWPEVRVVMAHTVDFVKKLGLSEIGKAGLHSHGKESYHLMGRYIDQMAEMVKLLRKSPDSRRIIVSAWNPALIQETSLPACHCQFQVLSYDNGKGKKRQMTLKLLIRSNDFPVGNPANVMQYALLAHMLAHITNHEATKLVVNIGDAHIYEDQIELMQEVQLKRVPIDINPTVTFDKDIKELSDFTFDRITVDGYEPGSYHPAISYPVAV